MSNEVLDDVLSDVLSDVASTIDKKPTPVNIVDKKPISKFKSGVGIDIGTSFIVVTRQLHSGEFVHKFHRNMLYPLDISEESTDMLENGSYPYIKSGDKYYVVGDAALSICLAIGKGEVIRPMSAGVLSTSISNASELIFLIIKSVLGEPLSSNEPLRVSIPANAIDANIDNLFHKIVLNNFFKTLGYDPRPVNEAMCVAYITNPKVKTEEGEEIPLSGIAISMGAGLTNVALLFRGMELGSFSVSKSGDYIDEMSSLATGIQKSKTIKKKEKDLNLITPNHSDRALSALSIYYTEYIDRVVHYIKKEFSERKSEISGEAEIVIAGGTSMPQGFITLFEQAISNSNFPFKISKIVHATNPFYAVSEGACLKARSDFEKRNKVT